MKKAFLIVFSIGAVLFIVAFAGVFMFVKMAFGDLKPINTDNIHKVRQIEIDRITNLPEIKALIIDENTTLSPFKGRKSALTLINLGIIFEESNTHFTTSKRRSKSYSYRTNFLKTYSGYHKDSIMVLIDQNKYFLSLDSIFLISPDYDLKIEAKKGILETGFTTDYYLNESLRNNYDFKIENVKSNNERDYLKKHKILMDLRNKFPKLKAYDLYWTDRKKYYNLEGTPNWYYGFSILEYNLRKGDTLVFKGKITKGKIIKLF